MISEETLIRKGTPKGKGLDLGIRTMFAGLTYLILFVAVLLFCKNLLGWRAYPFQHEGAVCECLVPAR